MNYKSRRCTRCAVNWPYEAVTIGDETITFERCPDCDEETWRSINEQTVDSDEFRRAHSHRLFERYLEARENRDRDLIERVEPVAFAQYLMDSAAEQIERDTMS